MTRLDEPLDPVIVDSLKRMSPDERLAEALSLHKWGQQLAEAGVRGQRPDWSDAEVEAEVLRRMLGAAAGSFTLRRNRT